jgi:hypothetical protein
LIEGDGAGCGGVDGGGVQILVVGEEGWGAMVRRSQPAHHGRSLYAGCNSGTEDRLDDFGILFGILWSTSKKKPIWYRSSIPAASEQPPQSNKNFLFMSRSIEAIINGIDTVVVRI